MLSISHRLSNGEVVANVAVRRKGEGGHFALADFGESLVEFEVVL